MTIQEIRQQINEAMPKREDDTDKSAAVNLARNAKSSDGRTVDGGVARIVFCACKGSAKNLQFCLYKQNNNLFKLKLEHCGKDFERFLSGRRFDYEITGISGDLDSIWTALQQAQKWYNGQDTRNDSSIRKIYEDYKAWKSTQKSQNSKSSQKKTSVKNITGEQQQSFEDALNKVWSQVQEVLKEINESSHDDKTKKEFWKEHTPWKKPDYQDDVTYILQKDYEDVSNYIGEKEQDIRKEVPPQPYIGDPSAPIWILPINPSYSAVDVLDLVGKGPGVKAINNDVDCLCYNVTTSLKGEENRYFNNRKKLLDVQNRFAFSELEGNQDFSCPMFYVLDQNFNTIQSRQDKKHFGSYEWWSEYLLKRNICKGDLSKFFVLESFPYHSKSFDGNTIKPWIHSKSHFLFWVKMVAYALANKRILLCRGMEIAKRVHDIAEKIGRNNADTNQIFVCKSESFSISTGNFFSYKDTPIIEKMELDAENRFRTALGKAMEQKEK